MSSTATATTTATSTTNKRSSKRFSFAGFSLFNKTNTVEKSQPPPSPPSQEQQEQQKEEQVSDDERRRRRRAQKSQSLYLQSFRNLTNKSRPTSTQYDPAEANQVNHKEVRSTIRRSLSAVLYATPQQQKQQSSGSAGLVPVLVTQDLSDRHGGMITPHDENSNKKKKEEEELAATKKKKQQQAIEYDNTLDIIPDSKKDELVIIWQGYGYTQLINDNKAKDKKDIHIAKQELDGRFEKEVWTEYRGLIHPLHLFQDADDENEGQNKWGALSVEELRRYFDNYGSMLLKLRDRSMMRQQRQYLVMDNKAKDDWILPQATEAPAPASPTTTTTTTTSAPETCNS